MKETSQQLFTTRVGELVPEDFISVREGSSIQETASLMAKHSLTSILVSDKNGIPTGIVTDRDICEKVAATGRSCKEPISNIRSLPLIRVDASEFCIEAVVRMLNHNMTHIVVVQEGRLKGVLTTHDILKLLHITTGDRECRRNNGDTTDLKPSGELPSQLLKAIHLMENRFQDDISLDALARESNMSKYHFCRLFTRSTGITPMKYLARIRIGKAKELLAGGGLTVAEISSILGFKDPHTFIRQFKALAGMTPAVYMEINESSPALNDSDACRNEKSSCPV